MRLLRLPLHHRLLFVPLALVLAAACSSDESKDPSAPTSSPVMSEVIDEAGGEVEIGGASVNVPAGAVANNTEISISELSTQDADELALPPAGTRYAAAPAAFLPHGLTFDKPVTISIDYEPEADQVYWMAKLEDESDRTWEVLADATIENGVASIEVTSFSIYAVVRGNASANTNSSAASSGGSTNSNSNSSSSSTEGVGGASTSETSSSGGSGGTSSTGGASTTSASSTTDASTGGLGGTTTTDAGTGGLAGASTTDAGTGGSTTGGGAATTDVGTGGSTSSTTDAGTGGSTTTDAGTGGVTGTTDAGTGGLGGTTTTDAGTGGVTGTTGGSESINQLGTYQGWTPQQALALQGYGRAIARGSATALDWTDANFQNVPLFCIEGSADPGAGNASVLQLTLNETTEGTWDSFVPSHNFFEVYFDSNTPVDLEVVVGGSAGQWCQTNPVTSASTVAYLSFLGFNSECNGSGDAYASEALEWIEFRVRAPGAETVNYAYCVSGFNLSFGP